MNGYVYKYSTRNVYEWGKGYVSREVYDRWNEFWDRFIRSGQYLNGDKYEDPIFWRVLPSSMAGSCNTLVCLGGSMYLHPMGGEMFRVEIGSGYGDSYFKELKEILFACVKYIGNGAEVDVSSTPAEVKI